MTRAVQELLSLKPKRPECDMVPDRGRHGALAVVRFKLTKKGWPKPHYVNVCAKHERLFIERNEAAGITLSTEETWG